MGGFLLRRLAVSLLLALSAASLAYLLAAATLDPRGELEHRSPPPPPQVIDSRLSELNLNDRTPLPRRYLTWASGVAVGRMGRTVDGEPVGAELKRRVWVTVRLVTLGAVLGGAAGVGLGHLSAVRRFSLADRAATVGSFAVLATPVFVLGVLLQIGAERINDLTGTRLFEWVGEYTPGAPGWLSRLQHLVLPTLTIGLVQVALVSRYQRGLMLDVLRADFVRTAMAKGLTRRTALRRHALRVALIPLTTYVAYNFGLLLLGAAFTEKIFGWHGMGEWLLDSIGRGDVNAVAAYGVLASGLILLVGLSADVVHALLDPRVRACR